MAERPWIVVFRLPELFEVVAQHLDPKSIHSLRLVCRAFHNVCAPYFSITLNVGHVERCECLKALLEAASTTNGGCNPLDQIQSVVITGFPHSQFSMLDPKGGVVLNQLQNIRHLSISKITRLSEKLYPLFPVGGASDPPMMLWDPLCFSPSDGLMPEEHVWSLLDLLPLEGSILCRLESLKITLDESRPVYHLDRFFTRLGQSCVSKSLRSLAVIVSRKTQGWVSWKIFQDLFEGETHRLLGLEALEMDNLTINGHIQKSKPDAPQPPTHQSLQSKVKRLTFNYPSYDTELKFAIMELFPNVEVLTFQSRITVPHLPGFNPTSPYSRATIERFRVLFPRLKVFRFGSEEDTRNWGQCPLLRPWIQNHPGIRLDSWNLLPSTTYIPNPTSSFFEENRVTFERLKILPFTNLNKMDVYRMLESSFFSNLEVIESENRIMDSNDIALLALDNASCPNRRIRTRVSWAATLTRLCVHTVEAPALQQLLSSLPRLVDFEIPNPLMSLSLFDELGRREPSSACPDPEDLSKLSSRSSSLSSSSNTLVDYRRTERPCLERLTIHRSHHSYQHADHSLELEEWRRALLYKFRFLSSLHVD
ncbi:hypothetical protein EMPS_00769 [Entomortierella parvispora]|uniref:F-box domain-containing protein n=1 Tax=Entomortierella parvispora TaxID=205924 RepID=A0A9P3LRY9_9FUNG|nr:hypothetical protein EMPS_00769 [Entomortierella parvispora]